MTRGEKKKLKFKCTYYITLPELPCLSCLSSSSILHKPNWACSYLFQLIETTPHTHSASFTLAPSPSFINHNKCPRKQGVEAISILWGLLRSFIWTAGGLTVDFLKDKSTIEGWEASLSHRNYPNRCLSSWQLIINHKWAQRDPPPPIINTQFIHLKHFKHSPEIGFYRSTAWHQILACSFRVTTLAIPLLRLRFFLRTWHFPD